MLAISGRTVAALLASGELPSVVIRRCRRVRRVDVAALLDGRLVAGERRAPATLVGPPERRPPPTPTPASEESPPALEEQAGGGQDIPF